MISRQGTVRTGTAEWRSRDDDTLPNMRLAARPSPRRPTTTNAEHADEVLGRWAAVMLNAEVYAEIIDRHVELAGDIAWIGGLLDTSHPPDDVRRQRRARGSAAVQIENEPGVEWLADRIVVIAQLAEALDRGTLELALRIVPVQWWEARLGTAPPA